MRMRAPPNAFAASAAHSAFPPRMITTVESTFSVLFPDETTSKPRSRKWNVPRRASPRVFVALSTSTLIRTESGTTRSTVAASARA